MVEDPGHRIAVEAANLIVKRGLACGLNWTEMCVCLETTLAIVVVAAAHQSKAPDRVAFATEVINTATEQAHVRATELLK